MDNVDHRRHPRGIVAVAAVVSPQRSGPVTGVIDLSEGGACLEWTLVGDLPSGTPVRLCFLLEDAHGIEVDGVIARVQGGRCGVAFDPSQRGLVQQLLAEIQSED
jgi:PilZ domain